MSSGRNLGSDITEELKVEQAKKVLRELFPHGHPRFIDLAVEEIKLHSEKNHDYARGGNPLGNFYRVSETMENWRYKLAPHDVALTYMMKQVDAVGNMLGGKYDGSIEGVISRLQDISVYSKLAHILYEEAMEF